MMRPPPAQVPDELLSWLSGQLPGTPTQVGKWVRTLSDSYVRTHDAGGARLGGRERLAAYGRYYLPVNYPKLHLPLAELAIGPDPLGREKLRVLDLGSGPGTFSLSVLGFLAGRENRPAKVELVLVDTDTRALEFAREACEWMAAGLPDVQVDVLTRKADLFEALPVEYRGRGFDLVVIGNALAEWARGADAPAAAAKVAGAMKLLREGGALVVIEPALRETSRFLLEVRDRLLEEKAAHLYAPCLHEHACPALARERDWCHERLDWDLPGAIAQIDRAAGLQKGSLAFSYLTLRREALSLADVLEQGPAGWTAGRVVSDAMVEKGKRGCIACTRQGVRVYYETLDRKATAGTMAALQGLERGSVAAFAPGKSAGERTRLGPDEGPRVLGPRRGRE